MLNSKTFRVVASLIIAILLWAFVIGTQTTSTTQEVSNIPLTFNHEVELNERGLAVSSVNLDSIDVEVTGARSLVSNITANDVTATVDLATAAKGENELNIVVRVPTSTSGIRVNSRTASKATVIVEDLVQKQVDVSINYTGTFDEGQAGDTVSIATPKITVSGAESLVNTVASVRGNVDASRLGEDPTEIICQLQPVNKEGTVVSGVVLSQESVTVKSVLSETKKVPVSVDLVDNSSDGMVRKIVVPEEVAIVGRADILSRIEQIEAKPVVVTNIQESGDIDLEFELPEGVNLSDTNEAENLKAQLTVAPVATKTFTYNLSDIELTGVSNRMEYTAPSGSTVVVSVMDSTDVLARVNKNSIKVSCDVLGLSVGTSTVGIGLNSDIDLYGLSANPDTIEVTATDMGSAAARIQTNLIASSNTINMSTSGNNNADSDATNG